MTTLEEADILDHLTEVAPPDADVDVMAVWKRQKKTHRKCQHCKQPRDCRHGPDPYLFYFHDEIEPVWLCKPCFNLRKTGDHLPEGHDEE